MPYHNFGDIMARMSVRATYALDEETAQRIKRLAGTWGVSQAEVVRRSVERAALEDETGSLTPADVVAHYVSQPPPRSKAETRRLVKSLRRLRHEDDRLRAGPA